MASIDSASLPSPAERRDGHTNPFAGIRAFFSDFLAKGIQPLPAGTALHARTGPGLPRQAGCRPPEGELTFPAPTPFTCNFDDEGACLKKRRARPCAPP